MIALFFAITDALLFAVVCYVAVIFLDPIFFVLGMIPCPTERR